MNRQQWAITLTGIGSLLLVSVLLAGGPVFEFSCVNDECSESIGNFVLKVLWSFFAVTFGGITLAVGIVLFIIDASQPAPTDDAE